MSYAVRSVPFGRTVLTPGPIHAYLSADHRRLEELLVRSVRPDGSIDQDAFTSFRAGLLRHIGIEESLLFQTARRLREGSPLPVAAVLHADHAAIAGALVLSPSAANVELIRELLEPHNPLEEAPGGLYEEVEQLAGSSLEELMGRVTAAPSPKLAPYYDTPLAKENLQVLLRTAHEAHEAWDRAHGLGNR